MQHGNAFGNADHECNLGLRCLLNGLRREARRHKDHRAGGPHLINCLLDGIEYRHVTHGLTALSGCDTTNNLCAVFLHGLSMKRTVPAGDTLNNHSGFFIH